MCEAMNARVRCCFYMVVKKRGVEGMIFILSLVERGQCNVIPALPS